MNRNPVAATALPLFVLPVLLAACAATPAPAVVNTPGMPNAELALQRSLDRVHDFLAELNDRIGAPARQIAAAPGVPAQAIPNLAPAHPIQLAPGGTPDATPIVGRNGTVYFPFSGGTARIQCRPGSVCMLRLGHDEEVTQNDIRLDDPASWTVRLASAPRERDHETVLAIMPAAGASATVLHVRSSQHSYHIALEPSADTSMLLVSFTHRPDDPIDQTDPDAVAQPTTAVASAKPARHYGTPDFGYLVLGASPPWRPLRVYADGGKTYVQFPAGGVLAAPRLLSSSGASGPTALTPITYRIEGDSYVVDRVLDDALLIAGTGPQQQTVLLRHVKAS